MVSTLRYYYYYYFYYCCYYFHNWGDYQGFAVKASAGLRGTLCAWRMISCGRRLYLFITSIHSGAGWDEQGYKQIQEGPVSWGDDAQQTMLSLWQPVFQFLCVADQLSLIKFLAYPKFVCYVFIQGWLAKEIMSFRSGLIIYISWDQPLHILK